MVSRQDPVTNGDTGCGEQLPSWQKATVQTQPETRIKMKRQDNIWGEFPIPPLFERHLPSHRWY